MRMIRIFLRRYPAIGLALLALTLCVKAIVPSGYMFAPDSKNLSITVAICTGIDTMQKTMELPTRKSHDSQAPHGDSGDSPCAFTALSHAPIGGADGILLAAALIVIWAAGFAAISAQITGQRRYLRPPLRGPPLYS